MFRRMLDAVLRPRPPEDTLTIVQAGDASLDAARADARATLEIFWRKFEAADGHDYLLKVGLTTPNEAVEHLWLAPSGWQDGKIVGRLMSQPSDLPDVDAGDEVLVEPERVSDWSYVRDGKLYGAFTERVLMVRLKPAMRRQLEEALAPTAIEPESN